MLISKFLPMVGAAALLAAGLLASAPAQAVVFPLDVQFCTGGCTVPAGTVTVLQAGTSVTIDAVLNDSNMFVRTGALSEFFDFNGAGVSVGDITINTPTGAGIPTFTFNTPSVPNANVGTFDFSLTCTLGTTNCQNGAAGSIGQHIMLTIANATVADVTGKNAAGFVFAGDILSGNGNTGVIGAVPAPAIGHGLLVLLAVGGVLFGGKLLENLKKRNLQAA